MNRERSEKGAVLVLVAVSMIVFLGFAALVIDLGYLYLTKNQLHVAADGAALAGAAKLSGTPTDCTNSAARTEAFTFAAYHNAAGSSVNLDLNETNASNGDIVLGNFTPNRTPGNPADNFRPCPGAGGTPVNAVRVRTRRTGETGTGIASTSSVSTFFASALNPAFATSNVGAFATAIGGVRGDSPICIPDCAFNPGCPTTGIVLQPESGETSVWTSFLKDPQPNPQDVIGSYITNPESISCIGLSGQGINFINSAPSGLYKTLDNAINDDACTVDDSGRSIPASVVLPVCGAISQNLCKTNNPCVCQNCNQSGNLPIVGYVVFTFSDPDGAGPLSAVEPPPGQASPGCQAPGVTGNDKGIYGTFSGTSKYEANCSGLVE